MGKTPLSVEKALKEMPAKIPKFKTLCEAVLETTKRDSIFVKTFEPEQGGPQGAYIQGKTIWVNEKLDDDKMVNMIVFELTNLMHSPLLAQASAIKDKSESAAAIEQHEYHGVLIQSEIMKEVKKENWVVETPYADLVKQGGRWDTFEKYLAEQKRTGHTARYQK